MLPSYIGKKLRANEDPTRVNQHYKFERDKIPKIRCAYHKDFYISHFCKEQQCTLPLCHECVKKHEEWHYEAKSRSIILY